MADVKTKYPVASENTVDLTLSPASLASSSTLLAGREATAVDNTTNLDLDHLLSGVVRVGTTPTIDTVIEVWGFGAWDVSGGTPGYPDTLAGTDAAVTITANAIKIAALRLIAVLSVDTTTSDRDYYFPPTSIAALFGGHLPPYWGVWLTHNTGVALNATGTNHKMTYHRIQRSVA